MEEEEYVEYMREGVNLVVQTEGDEMKITHSDLSAEQTWRLIIFLIDKLSAYTGIRYNDIVSDLREIEDEEGESI